MKDAINDFIGFCIEAWWLILFLLLAVVGLVIVVGAAIQAEARWQVFAQENGCKVVETIPGTVGTSTGVALGTGSNGQVTVTPVVTTTIIPDRNKWVCLDESVHWR